MDHGDLPLEDSWNDVLRKAFRGLHPTEAGLAQRAGLSPGEVAAILGGRFEPGGVERLAEALGLHGPALLALARGGYHPGGITLPAGMARFTSDWDGLKVHSYLAWGPRTLQAVAFDTGADAGEMLSFVAAHGLKLRLLLLTHGHGDHLFDLDRVVEKTGAQAWLGEGEDVPGVAAFPAGREFQAGSLRIGTRLTRGHSPGGITYVLHGLERPVAVVGDALFAGSMGGPVICYADSLRTNREEILSLPPETILCPGHGPLTTVALERKHNPFFAGEAGQKGA